MLQYLNFLIVLVTMLFCACGHDGTPEEASETPEDTSATEETVSKGFDELASDYYDIQSRVIWQKPEIVLNLLGNLKGRTIADIGTGTGFFAFRIANAGAKVIAIDIDPRAIEWVEAEKRHYPAEVQILLETRLAAPENPNLKSEEVDVVLMVNTYIYLENRVAYFRNLRKGLKKDGRVIIIDFKEHETPIGPKVEERIAQSQVHSELIQAGYTVTSADDKSLEYQYIIVASPQL